MARQWFVVMTYVMTTERKCHSWLNGVALTICPSMWRRQRRLCWTSGGGTPLTTPHWPSTARLWRESAALNSWGCTSWRISPGPPTPCHSPRRHNSAYTFSAGWKEQVSHHPSSPHSTGAPLTSCITVWYGNCSAADRKTLQRTVNTAAKIIGAPLPSILDIFLARCSSKTNSIVKDPTHPSHSLFQLLLSGRRYRSIRAHSARLLNSFFPQAVRALNSNHPALLWNPMQTPTSWNMDHLPWCFTSLLYVCIYVAPWSCEARYFVPLYVPTCSGMTIKLNLTWLDLMT